MKSTTEPPAITATVAQSPLRRTASRLPATFLTIRALYALCLFDLFGFRKHFAPMRKFMVGRKISRRKPERDFVEQACRAVNQAIVFYPRRVLCLQRSFVTTVLLRSLGVPAEVVVGAQGVPFKAHAWTEVNSSPVNEYRDVRKLFQQMDRF